ncbi:STAS domain-containing protein [candidate division KSB1 bacterium]|nr:STAS domain-containing protein [candidate division KSB1 bacterium]NIR69765.1 STAS domain-containing protein [candidate division KSB1 bacterium]NIS22948.1 STAS domain-containing protein [candidate division KSB1 bacterium]NIT69805.1 STAS domain-containing protein [candidate division KSB1 bacterium]NIU23479.1 STAS domain-containing protein [candidate division KSB1 bacterium]
MTFSEQKIEGFPVFELEGKIMGDKQSLILCDRLKEHINAGEKRILLDLSKVRWINSFAIGQMLSCLRQIRNNGGDLYFSGIQGRVAYYFKITKLETELKIYENVGTALEELTISSI